MNLEAALRFSKCLSHGRRQHYVHAYSPASQSQLPELLRLPCAFAAPTAKQSLGTLRETVTARNRIKGHSSPEQVQSCYRSTQYP